MHYHSSKTREQLEKENDELKIAAVVMAMVILLFGSILLAILFNDLGI